MAIYLFIHFYAILYLQWYKTSDPSVILSNQTTYSVQAATVATSGVYVCRPRNRQGFGSEGRVTVIVSPLPTTTAALDTTEPLTTTMATKEVSLYDKLLYTSIY